MDLGSLKGPSEVLASRVKAFKKCLALATDCLSNNDYSNAEMIYGGLLGDLHKDCIVEALNLNDLELFSLHICFAYSSIGTDSKSEQALVILNSIHKPIKMPLVPYLKAFVHISNDRISFAHDEIQFCQTLLKDGYNFKSNNMLNEQIIPEINDGFLKLKLQGLKFICGLVSDKEEENSELKKFFKDDFKENWLKIGKLSEADFATLGKNEKEVPKVDKSPKKIAPKNQGATKKLEKPTPKNKCIAIQVVPPKGISVAVQTMEKEIDKQLLSAILEIKNKMNNMQNKKDNEIKQLLKKNNELSEKLIAQEKKKEEKSPEFEFLKDQYFILEKKLEQTQKQNDVLQKLLIEQMHQKYQMQKSVYQIFEEKCEYKFSYLSDLYQYLYPSDKPSPEECKQEAFLWKNTQDRISEAKQKFEAFYKIVDDLISAKKYDAIKISDWPVIPSIPNDIQDVIYRNFKSLVQYNKSMYSVGYPNQYSGTFSNSANLRPRVNSNNFVTSYNKYNQDGRTTGSPQYTPIPTPPQTRPETPKMMNIRQISPHSTSSSPRQVITPSPSTEPSVYELEQSLLKCLYTTFKDVDEVQLLEAIYKVRDTNGGNLLNIPDYVLVAEIKKILMKKNKNGKTAWSSVSQVHWQNDHSESKCCICFEDFNPNNSHMLACQHEFHKKCITDWLKRKSACPVCRVYAVIDEDYPPLKP